MGRRTASVKPLTANRRLPFAVRWPNRDFNLVPGPSRTRPPWRRGPGRREPWERGCFNVSLTPIVQVHKRLPLKSQDRRGNFLLPSHSST